MTRPTPLWLLVVLQGGISAASLVVEIVAGRMLAPHVGMSLYTWTAVIAVVLAGFSAGHWWGGRLAALPTDRALAWTGGATLAAALTTAAAVLILPMVAGPVLAIVTSPVWGITALTMVVFFLPSFFAGVPAPVLAQIAITANPDRSGPALGAMFASGAVGAIAGVLLAGIVFIAWLGSALTLVVVTIVYIASGLLFFWLARSRGFAIALLAGAAAAGMAGLALAAPQQCHQETQYFCLRVEDLSADPSSPVHLMVIDHLAHGISARDAPQVQFTVHGAMLDTLTRMRAPREDFSTYVIGGGSFSVPRSLMAQGAGPMTVAEIDPEVTQLAEDAFWFDASAAEIWHEDARRALLIRPERQFDIIIGDAFTDVVVPVHLVTREFFELVAARMTPEGSFLMTVIDYEDRLGSLGSIIMTLREVFPVVEVWTQAGQPARGSRMVFAVVAGSLPTPVSQFTAPAPDLMAFAALDDRFVQALAADRGMILTDDYAPIDRLMGRPD
ncbi:fused MFS/spermidine synthase [Roseicyclus marinus]|uniref:fused MFS/spermidine synthase n=1 Tax=Roseicyclus marinus TaxID=2161673 RepID=UPI0024101CB3|nr:fused MFS/spermidine synthase [Roseicyclus marinus]MDG3039968.1 fused MFS/spermidine synthase [Roseicyclus marinus]